MILVFGSINVDLVARVEAIPRPGETVLSPGSTTHFGGKGANQAVAAARAGAKVQMVGAIGPDAFGATCLANFRKRGVGVDGMQTADLATGVAFITVDRHGENAITVASGANGQLLADKVPQDLLETASVCVLQMEVPVRETLQFAMRAKAVGARVVLNYAPAPARIDPDLLEPLLSMTDVLVLNEHEAATILAMAPRGAGTAADLAQVFALEVVQTLGAQGADWLAANGARAHQPAQPVQVVDTTGAGDTFVGALSAALAAGHEMAAALAAATSAAAAACGWLGAQPPLD